MTIWEKATVNIQKGSRRLGVFAATFSERVKTEIAIVRLKMKADDIQAQIDELHRIIGRKAVRLSEEGAATGTVEQFLKDAEISVAMTELAERTKERAELNDDLKNAYGELRDTTASTEVAR